MVLETFECFLDKIDGAGSYIRMTDSQGREFWAEYPTKELVANGIRERRKFILRVVKEPEEATARIELEAIPDKILTEEDYIRIHKLIEFLEQ